MLTMPAGEVESTAPLVVLIHGLHSNQEELSFVKAGLERAGMMCVLPRIEGYTFNDVDTEKSSNPDWRSWVNQLVVELYRLKALYGRVVLTGISTGANLSLAAALEASDALVGLVPLSTSLFIDGWKIPSYNFLVLLAYYTPLGVFWTYKESPPYGVQDERIRHWIERELACKGTSAAGSSTIPNNYLRENHRLQRWLRKRLKKEIPNLPLLAIHAINDEIASIKNVNYLEKYWPNHYFSKLILSQSYHMISIDRERAKVISAIINFVGKVEQTSLLFSEHKHVRNF